MSEVVETDRKLATIRQISAIDPIPDADAIDVATVDGWKVVVKKGDFSVGDLCVYFEIDSWCPATIAPFLNKGRMYNGVEGERLRTKKLRGQISQGLILPLSVAFNSGEIEYSPIEIGDDMTEILGIQKFEKPIPASLRGVARGNFPSFIRKTDQERIQNLKKYLGNWIDSKLSWEVQEKCEGSSMTVYLKDGIFGCCSRNIDLVETEGNAFWDAAKKFDIENKIRNSGVGNIALQIEILGPGIQKNIYNLKKCEIRVFDIFDIDTQTYYTPKERRDYVDKIGLDSAPLIDGDFVIPKEFSMDNMIVMADGKSAIGDLKSNREGLVFKCNTKERLSFKIVSNLYLLNEK